MHNRRVVAVLLVALFAGMSALQCAHLVMDTSENLPEIPTAYNSHTTGADVDILTFVHPSETTCTTGGHWQTGCTNELPVGESTKFDVLFRNVGDRDITDMAYSVDIYLTDSTKTRGLMAKDSAGNELSWTNDVAVCDDAMSCDETSFAAGSNLGGGITTLKTMGSEITWSPVIGTYLVVVSIDSDQDVNQANDEEEIYIVVRDYTDIEVDLCWTDGAGVCEQGDRAVGTGTESRQFLLTVTADGSQDFNPREATIRLEFDGFSTVSAGDFSLANNGSTWLVVSGSDQTVEVFRNTTTDTGTDGTRKVLSYQTAWTLTGTATPNGDAYYIEAGLDHYSMYGQIPSCSESWIDDPSAEPPVELTSDNFCEFQINKWNSQQLDDYVASDSDEIYGFTGLFHDIRVQTLTLAQGYNADGSGQPTSIIRDSSEPGPRVGTTLLHATVGHFGSDVSKMVEWNLVFTVTLPNGMEVTYNANDCPTGLAPAYTHKLLGTYNGQGTPKDADVAGHACVMLNNNDALTAGEYTFEADLNFQGVWDTTAERLDAAIADEKSSNNQQRLTVDVVNTAPRVLSLDLHNTGDLIVSQEAPLEFDVLAVDLDCISGDCLTYTWSVDDVELGMCGGVGDYGAQCTFQILPEYVPAPRVKVTVTDDNGASASEYVDITIWNDEGYADTTEAGVYVEYRIESLWDQKVTFSVTDRNANSYTTVQLPNFVGEHDSVSVVQFTPSTSLVSSAVRNQSLIVEMDKSILLTDQGVFGSLWFVQGSSYTMLDDAPQDSSKHATKAVFEYIPTIGSNTLTAGELVVFASAGSGAPPISGISEFSAMQKKGGIFELTWASNLSLSTEDSYLVKICDTQIDEECVDSSNWHVTKENRYVLPAMYTVHGKSYFTSVEVCNARSCNPQSGSAILVADKQVDGDGRISYVSVIPTDDNVRWAVTWSTSGDTSDIDSWRLCYSTQSIFIDNGNNECVIVAHATSELELIQPMFKGSEMFYFYFIALDEIGNEKVDQASTSVSYFRDWDFDDDGTPNGLDADDDNDGVVDEEDDCTSADLVNWTSDNMTDHDKDGCRDMDEDFDDDNDGLSDDFDDCARGVIGWNQPDNGRGDNGIDKDEDGCHPTEDLDDDGDLVNDTLDLCPLGRAGWESNQLEDWDLDGCHDATEDDDDDGDGVLDEVDACPMGLVPNQFATWNDLDSDGCEDNEDADIDGDGVMNLVDVCPMGMTNWTSTNTTDMDVDGCRDVDEDLDDDGDGRLDAKQFMLKGEGAVYTWTRLTAGILLSVGVVLVLVRRGGGREDDEEEDEDQDEYEAFVSTVTEKKSGPPKITVDENGVEWWEDEVGTWWFRSPDADDWQEWVD